MKIATTNTATIYRTEVTLELSLERAIKKKLGTGTSCNENFLNGFVVAGVGFLSYWNYQQSKFEEEKKFGL
jgi:hypothetical protein